MEDTLFKALLVIGIAGWVRPVFDRPSADQLSELADGMSDSRRRAGYLATAMLLVILSLTGLIGMFFAPAIFRWVYAASVAGRFACHWYLPVASNKPKRDQFFAELLLVVDGAILVLAFTGLANA